MRIAHLTVTAAAAVATFVIGASAITAQPRRAAPAAAPPLLPLSDRDQNAARGSGCQLSFNTARSTLVYAIGHELMIRTRAGRTVCPISDAQFSALSGGGTRSCGGLRLTIRQTGRSI